MTSYLPPQDSQVLHTQDFMFGRLLVLARKQEIEWRDGQRRWLHTVGKHVLGELMCMPIMRAAQINGAWHIFELGGLHDDLRSKLQAQHLSDQPGFIFYTLRLSLPNAAAFDALVQGVAIPHTQERLAA